MRRWFAVLVASLVLAAAIPFFVGAGSAGGPGPRVADLTGTWSSSDGPPWTFSGDGSGGYTATYTGTGAHSKLVGTVTGTYEGSSFTGSVHAEEPNQVEGGPPTITEGTIVLHYEPSDPPALVGEVDNQYGTFPVSLRCQSGPCLKVQCSFVRRGEEAFTREQALFFDDIDFLLSTGATGGDCSVSVGKDRITAFLSTDTLVKGLARDEAELKSAFPDASDQVRAKVAESVRLATVLKAVTTDGQPQFPGVAIFLDSGAFARMAAAALKGDATAADALGEVLRLIALNDTSGGTT